MRSPSRAVRDSGPRSLMRSTQERAPVSSRTRTRCLTEAELIVKVKEPLASEVAMLEPRHTLFAYLHLGPEAQLTADLVASGATCMAYETVEDSRGRLPLLAPMSMVAGRIAAQAGAYMLAK